MHTLSHRHPVQARSACTPHPTPTAATAGRPTADGAPAVLGTPGTMTCSRWRALGGRPTAVGKVGQTDRARRARALGSALPGFVGGRRRASARRMRSCPWQPGRAVFPTRHPDATSCLRHKRQRESAPRAGARGGASKMHKGPSCKDLAQGALRTVFLCDVFSEDGALRVSRSPVGLSWPNRSGNSSPQLTRQQPLAATAAGF